MKLLVVILGATATGKTDLSIEMARRFGAPVISCDSRQFYREIPIGTAAPTAQEQGDVPHYFVGTRSVTEDYNCGKFESDAMALLDELFKTHSVVVMTGGSGLYIDAVCKGMDDVPTTNPALRDDLQNRLESEGIDSLLAQLKDLDPEYYEKVDKRNHVRITRALEVCLETGKPFTQFRRGEGTKRDFAVAKIGIEMERPLLYERINMRVDLMMSQGLLEEAENVYPLRQHNALQTVGYRELFDYFAGTTTLPEAVELIKRNSRRYAKRQITWFGKDPEISWFKKNEYDKVEKYIKSFAE